MQASQLPTFRVFANIVHEILRHNDERGMTRQEIIGNSSVLLTAGSETTATILSGATYFMLQNPAVLHRVQKEVRETFKKEDDITLRSVSTPSSLTYMEAVLQESLRCYPSIPATLPRITGPEGALIDGNYVPAKVRRNLSFRIWSLLIVSQTFQGLRRRSSLVHIP